MYKTLQFLVFLHVHAVSFQAQLWLESPYFIMMRPGVEWSLSGGSWLQLG